MKPVFLLDEHISPRVAKLARAKGLDVVAVAGSDLAGLDDESLLRESAGRGRILVTYDIAHFVAALHRLLRERAEVPGIVFVDSRTISTAQVGRLVRALVRLAGQIRDGRVNPAGGVFLTAS